MDWHFIISHSSLFFDATLLTLKISFFGIFGAIILGLIISLVVYYKVSFFLSVAKIYLSVSRNTPLLIHLFFLYYGLGQIGLKIDAYHCAIIGIIFLGGSYIAESFTLGFESVPKIQSESAFALGLSKIQCLYHVILPQSLGISFPSLGANVIFLLKESSVVSAIALADIVFVTKDLIAAYSKTAEALFMLIIVYLVLLLPLSFLFIWLENYYKKKIF